MNEKFPQYPGQLLREDRLGLFTPSPFLPVHLHWTTTTLHRRTSCTILSCLLRDFTVARDTKRWRHEMPQLRNSCKGQSPGPLPA